jgi:hypothetical protein
MALLPVQNVPVNIRQNLRNPQNGPDVTMGPNHAVPNHSEGRLQMAPLLVQNVLANIWQNVQRVLRTVLM